MTGAIFKETLRRHWRGAVYWGIGMSILALYILLIFQDSELVDQYTDLVGSMPPVLLQMFGITNLDLLTSPNGMLSFGFFSYGILTLAVYSVIAGMNISANDEDDGIMDILLSLPLPRWRLIVERFLGYTGLIIVILIIAYGGIVLGAQATALEVDLGRAIENTLNMLPTLLMIMAFSAFMGAVMRRKSTALAVTAIFVIVSYIVNVLGATASGALSDALNTLSFYSYYDNEAVTINGLDLGNIALLVGLTVVLMAGSITAFQRRDIGV